MALHSGIVKQVQKQREKKCDVRILDMRVGRIVDVKKHPNADTLYVEEIDCGESSPRTVIAADVERYTLEQMTDRPVVVLCNVKPAKMRGIYSKGMLMCAVSQDKLELLEPPEDSVPGDRISFEGYPLDAYPTRLLNPKKKIFRRVQRYLCINSDGIATYRGIPFSVTGRGVCTVPSLTNAEIK
ncbi:aminoacyl tRNA synthase complex-interacting multifunctional protein 1-like [Saccoglossus kowalevskii]|uniref:Aminoacyl tRNA synthase complex-interacting multifunctional protein 1-like n=1 Tax=Saccoglossus kowalevskii TaxID=10224 RepID=A0ABM0MY53_SACKO|nr:PREDICTED: aminoacyl tRNA synthase complex-interacting multifunctional protein 1-like [Saccoglossus kowalevskii]